MWDNINTMLDEGMNLTFSERLSYLSAKSLYFMTNCYSKIFGYSNPTGINIRAFESKQTNEYFSNITNFPWSR